VSKRESEVTNAFWRELLEGKGTFRENFKIIDYKKDRRQNRWADGVVVQGDTPGKIWVNELRDLDGRDVTVIQTKVTPLNAYVFGQALFSPKLIAQSAVEQAWRPRSINSVLLCTSDQPEIRCLIDEHFSSNVEVHVREGIHDNFYLHRIPSIAEEYASIREDGKPIVTAACLTSGLTIDGVFVPGLSVEEARQPLCRHTVAGKKVTAVHSEQMSGKANRAGMYMAGEVIMTKLLLQEKMEAASVHSVIACAGMDDVIEGELRAYASFEVWDVS
jgi:hypothetical protein